MTYPPGTGYGCAIKPYDNAMIESFMKTLRVEGVYLMAFESAETRGARKYFAEIAKNGCARRLTPIFALLTARRGRPALLTNLGLWLGERFSIYVETIWEVGNDCVRMGWTGECRNVSLKPCPM